jgi:hypothetical protein
MSDEDFLSLQPIGSVMDADKQRAIEFAKLYVETFVLNPSGQKLLQHWTETFERKRTPINATLNDYVANERIRAFIQDIHGQIRFAQSDGRLA